MHRCANPFVAVSLIPLVALLPAIASAQEPDVSARGSTRIEDLSIEELLGRKTGVAALRPTTLRDSPGVITVTTREEILGSGARDLLDVLALVPGFWVGTDVVGVVGVAFRGVWGHEGKILLLIDGQEMNETLYSTLQLGNRFPVDQIARIEIIRGPGSAVYGGFAELAVINVITVGADDLGGVSGYATWGQMADDYGRRRVSGCFADHIDAVSGLSVSACATFGQGHRSDRPYNDFYGNTYPLTDDGELNPLFLNLGITFRNTKLRVMYDGYEMTTRDAYGESLPNGSLQSFKGLYASLEHGFQLNEKMTLTPRLFFKHTLPWQTLSIDAGYYDKTAQRYGAGVSWSWDVRDGINILAGTEVTRDYAYLNDTDMIGVGAQTQFGDENNVSYLNFAGFAQMLWQNPIVNVAAGVRYEHHSEVGGSFVPRLALTKVVGRFHFKALAAMAFRPPGIENINLGVGDLEPEQTRVFELEAGAELGDHLFAAVNAFDLTVEKPIVYFYDPATDIDGYQNFDQTGSRGVEVDLRIRGEHGAANVSYSYAVPAGKNEIDAYESGDSDRLLGLPAHKLAASGKLLITKSLTLDPSLVMISSVRGYVQGDGAGGAAVTDIDPRVYMNLAMSWTDAFVDGLRIQGAVHNLLDEELLYLQPYNGGHGPLPGPTREVVLTVAYEKQL